MDKWCQGLTLVVIKTMDERRLSGRPLSSQQKTDVGIMRDDDYGNEAVMTPHLFRWQSEWGNQVPFPCGCTHTRPACTHVTAPDTEACIVAETCW